MPFGMKAVNQFNFR